MSRRPGLRGFCGAYCEELSGTRTRSLRRLLGSALSDSPRVVEPLMVYALCSGQGARLAELARGTRLEGEYAEVASAASGFPDAESYLASGQASPRYASVLDAWRSGDDELAADRRISALMRARTLEALARTGVTRYRLCEELGLNKGNVYAYLAGDDTKVSRDTARRIMEAAVRG